MSGWEPETVTQYEYDDAGRLIGSVSVQEPEWSPSDKEALLAFIESQRVGPHGHPMSEATSPDGDPNNPDRLWDWVVPLPMVDFAQQALDKMKQAFKDAYPDHDMSAYMWRVEKRER